MESRNSRNIIIVLLVIFIVIVLPFGFYFYFEIKKNKTGVRLRKIPVLSQTAIPEFKLLAHTGAPITRDSLTGKIVIADFIFTRCRGICPVMSGNMAKLQDYIGKKNEYLQSHYLLLSHTVDPMNDSLEVLKSYAQRYGADGKLWLLATGDKRQLYDLAINFYKLPALETPEDSLNPYTHSERFILLDKEGYVRGYYDGTDSLSLRELMKDIVHLDLSYRVKKKE